MESEHINKESGKKFEVSILHIIDVGFDHVGEYKCHAASKERGELDFSKIVLNVTMASNVIKKSNTVRAKLHSKANLYCLVEGYPFDSLKWYKDNEEFTTDLAEVHFVNETIRNMTLQINELTRKDNGTFMCLVQAGGSVANASVAILVLDKPQVNIDFVKAIGKNKLYLNWTINDGNAPGNLSFRIQYMAQGDSNWFYYPHEIQGGNRSYVLQDIFKPDTEYFLRIIAMNSEGM